MFFRENLEIPLQNHKKVNENVKNNCVPLSVVYELPSDIQIVYPISVYFSTWEVLFLQKPYFIELPSVSTAGSILWSQA